MIVRCIEIIRPGTSTVVNEHPGVGIGEEYPVLGVLAARHRILLRLPDAVAEQDRLEAQVIAEA